jgi:class 3 adenylate cyclase/tetratricopeptide (TPR) repeat protein
MFTDIVGSADMKGKMPGATSAERNRAFLEKVKAPHETIIRERLAAHGGSVVKSTGDGLFIAFADAERAVLCAVEIQQKIAAALIFTPNGTLQIRIGLHSGHATPVEGDYTASAVDKSARVESKAAPGQVYLSREIHELIRGKIRGISTASAGTHDMKGVAKEELFVASADGSAVAPPVPAPPLSQPVASTSIPNNLPSLQPFFGREKELAGIANVLDPKSRGWGTLIDGDGGMGKTSLAVRAAYDASPHDFKKIVFISLKTRELDDDGVHDLSGFILSGLIELFNELARELGHADIAKATEGQRPRLLLDALRNTQTLLVLDNLESLTKAERGQLIAFVKRLPQGCKAILTARGRIGPAADELILERLSQDAALATLADMATHNPHLVRTSEAERITLYAQTVGNALLLRWTAGQLGRGHCRTFTDALAFLRTCPPGNDPLEFIFGDIVTELPVNETHALVALIYFTLPATVNHIVALTGLNEELTEIAMRSLSNLSLITPDQEEKAFGIVPMVHAFLHRKRPEIVAKTGRQLISTALRLIRDNAYDQVERFAELESAWPIVAAALPLLIKTNTGEFQMACDALQTFLEFSGRWDECLALCIESEKRAVAARQYQRANRRAMDIGGIFHLRRQSDQVFACADRAAFYCREGALSDIERASAVSLLALAHEAGEDYNAAIAAHREALDLFRVDPDCCHAVVHRLISIASCQYRSRDWEDAEQGYRDALSAARSIEYENGIGGATGLLAELALRRQEWSTAESLAREALLMGEKIGRQEMIGRNCHRLAQALARQDRKPEATPHARRAVEIFTVLRLPDLEQTRRVLAECEG